MKFIFFLVVGLFCSPLFSYSESIKLKSGKIIDAAIIKQTDEYIEVDIEGVEIKYYIDEVESIGAGSLDNLLDEETNDLTLEAGPKEIVISRFSDLESFSLDYHYVFKHVGVFVAKGEGGEKVPQVEEISGQIQYEKPDKFNIRYNHSESLYGKRKEFIVSDGETYWYSSYHDFRQKNPYINKESVQGRKQRYDTLMKSVSKMKEFQSRFQDATKSSINRADSLYSNPSMIEVVYNLLEDFGIQPFHGIEKENIEYKGQEDMNGEPVFKFEIKPSLRNRKMVHWIGVQDGIPRKIIEYNPYDNSAEIEINISNVRINQDFKLADFQYPQKEGDKIFDLEEMFKTGIQLSEEEKKELQEQAPNYVEDIIKTIESEPPGVMYEKMLDFLPQDTFEAFFDNPLTDIKELKGGGFSIIGYEVYISFQTDKELLAKNREKYIKKNPREALDWFKKAFPEEAQISEEGLIFLSYDTPQDKRWLLGDFNKGVYFFKATGGGMD